MVVKLFCFCCDSPRDVVDPQLGSFSNRYDWSKRPDSLHPRTPLVLELNKSSDLEMIRFVRQQILGDLKSATERVRTVVAAEADDSTFI